ncbi:MAG: FmdB family zinc ribbon protein [Puniceicoccaceae bacterium]
MPTYEYSCQSCGHEMEAFQRMSDDPLKDCPDCEEPALKRKIGLGAGIIFKGGGFYETDFKDKKGKKPSKPDEKNKASESKTTSGKKKETPASPAKD